MDRGKGNPRRENSRSPELVPFRHKTVETGKEEDRTTFLHTTRLFVCVSVTNVSVQKFLRKEVTISSLRIVTDGRQKTLISLREKFD